MVCGRLDPLLARLGVGGKLGVGERGRDDDGRGGGGDGGGGRVGRRKRRSGGGRRGEGVVVSRPRFFSRPAGRLMWLISRLVG